MLQRHHSYLNRTQREIFYVFWDKLFTRILCHTSNTMSQQFLLTLNKFFSTLIRYVLKKRNNIYIFMCSITRNFQHMFRLIFKNKTIMLSGIITEIIFNRTVFLFFDILFISWVRRDCCLMKVILFLSCVVMSWNLVQILHFDTIF